MSCPFSTLLGPDSCGRLDSLGSVKCALRQLRPSSLVRSLAPWQIALIAIVVIAKVPALLSWLSDRRESRRVVAFSHPPPPEAAPGWTGRIISEPDVFAHKRDPSLLPTDNPDPGGNTLLTCYDPSSGAHLATLPLDSSLEIMDRVRHARAAQPSLAASSFAKRRQFLSSLKAWIFSNMEDIVNVAVRDSGKTRTDAGFGEIITTLAKIDWLLAEGEKVLRPQSRKRTLLLAHKKSELRYEPLGVVAALVSWNYSFHNALGPILAGVFSGNAVMLKASEQVAWSSTWFVDAVKKCLAAVGLDPDVVQLVVCLPGTAEAITKSPEIRHITFIGSEPVGKKVALAAAENLTPTCLELGGKDPAFILPDADFHFFADTWMRGAFQGAGQNCIGIELYLVPRARQAEFVSLMAPRVKALRVGTDVGSVVSLASVERLESLVSSAVSEGAELHAGGQRYIHPERPFGAYFAPTLLSSVSPKMRIAREEAFGPIMTVVPYDSVEDALKWLRDSRFGLGASVYGANKAQCMKVAAELECGMVAVNDFGVFYLNQDLPFGGTKASGYGRFAGPEGLRSLCNPKAVMTDAVFKVRTSIPPPLRYPVDDDRAWGFLRALVGLGYAPLGGKVRAIFGLIRNS